MFWCRIGELIVLSGNNFKFLNATTQALSEIWAFHINDTLCIRYHYLFDNEHRLALRIAMELEG